MTHPGSKSACLVRSLCTQSCIGGTRTTSEARTVLGFLQVGRCLTCQDRLSCYLDPREDARSRTPKSGLKYSYGVDYKTLRRIYFWDPPRGRGSLVKVAAVRFHAKRRTRCRSRKRAPDLKVISHTA